MSDEDEARRVRQLQEAARTEAHSALLYALMTALAAKGALEQEQFAALRACVMSEIESAEYNLARDPLDRRHMRGWGMEEASRILSLTRV